MQRPHYETTRIIYFSLAANWRIVHFKREQRSPEPLAGADLKITPATDKRFKTYMKQHDVSLSRMQSEFGKPYIFTNLAKKPRFTQPHNIAYQRPSEGRGHWFDSSRARHKIKDLGHFSGGLFLWYGIHTENRIPYARPFHPIYLPPSPLSVRSACSHFARQNGALLCLWRCAWVLVAARAKRAPKGCKASGCYNISVRLFTLPCHGKPIFEAHPSPTEVC